MKEADRPPSSWLALWWSIEGVIEVFIEGVIECFIEGLWSIEGFIEGISDGMTMGSLAKAKRSRATDSLSGGGGDC